MSHDNKTDVIRHVTRQPVMQGKRVLMVGDRRDDMQGAVNCSLDAAAVLYSYGGGKSRPLCRSSWPLTARADGLALRPVDSFPFLKRRD